MDKTDCFEGADGYAMEVVTTKFFKDGVWRSENRLDGRKYTRFYKVGEEKSLFQLMQDAKKEKK